MNDPSQELEDALALVREALAKRQPLNRYHARAVLLPLGAELARAAEAAGRARVERLRELLRPVAAGWSQAVQDELEMAVAEFVKSVDRRYLTRPDYDFEYTLEARARVEDRLRAMRALEIEPGTEWLRDLERADREFAQHLARRGARG